MTKTQVQVAKMLAEGKTYIEIEKRLKVGRGFISYIRHRDRKAIERKIRLANEFLAYAECF